MHNLSKLAGGVAIAALLGNAALAADAVEAPPAPPVAAVEYAPAATWSGVYVGAFGGYNWGNFDSTVGDIDADGFNGGAFAGYNLQNGAVVYGLEGDIGYSGADGSLAGVSADQGVFGSLRGRIGYAFDPVLIYGTAGVAATRAEFSSATGTDENTHIGWTVGAGADTLITENVFGRLEYRYTDYQSQDYTLGATTVSSGFDTHTINAGIGVKF
ncbi:outer membrane protein [Oricola cellulosilytica]|uniref:Porin family protein n=1 Tax=Oricola cellulosilytica TaxID=1429082 RepID=A0A4R0PDP7_9HYPH|nr:outer membrane protein [Oricola cellulosilytica]TCD14325.1 porin family protein [Oricola cellulosilytica]